VYFTTVWKNKTLKSQNTQIQNSNKKRAFHGSLCPQPVRRDPLEPGSSAHAAYFFLCSLHRSRDCLSLRHIVACPRAFAHVSPPGMLSSHHLWPVPTQWFSLIRLALGSLPDLCAQGSWRTVHGSIQSFPLSESWARGLAGPWESHPGVAEQTSLWSL
jgi:hypothetical protein